MKFIPKGIKAKMIVYLGLLMVTICTGLTIVSYITSANALSGNINEVLPQMASESAKVVESRIQGEFNTLETLVSMEEICDSNVPWDDKKAIFDEAAKTKGFLRMGISNTNGDLVYNNGTTANIKDRPYFQTALSGKEAVSDPILAKTNNSLAVMFAVPFKMSDGSTSVLVAVRDGNELSTITSDITFGRSGKAYMVNATGILIAHSNNELIKNQTNYIEEAKKDSATLQALANVMKQMIEGKTGSGAYEYGGVNKIAGFAPIKNTGWSIAIAGDRDDFLSRLNPLKVSVIGASIIFIIISILLILIISGGISNSLAAAVKYLSIIAEGDLSGEMSPKFLSRKDEVGTLARSVKTMQNSVKDMIHTIKESSKNIDSKSESLSSVSQEMSSSAENVAVSTQDVAKGTGKQVGDLMETTGMLNEFSKQLGGIVQAIKDVDANANGISSMAESSNNSMQLLVKSMNGVNVSFKEFVTRISYFQSNVKQINEIISLINSIAGQTNLLALNAAIEAARAGESGKGFAVVADEIRKLAEQTKSSSESINTLIENIANDTDAMVKTTDITDQEINNQITVINSTVESFNQIIKAINEISPKINAVNTSVGELSGEKDRVLKRIEGVSSIAEEVSASSEEIAASSEEMNASAEEVASTAETLAAMTREMVEHVNKFKM